MIIGLFDDQPDELRKIRRTINPKNCADIIFKDYAISDISTLENIVGEVRDDIINERINSFIIDYQIFTDENFFNGADVYNEIVTSFPKFTTIILTQVIDEALKNTKIDSDKLYVKSDFFGERSAILVEKIFRNTNIYFQEKHDLIKKLDRLKDNISKVTDIKQEQQLIDEITCLEAKLNEYIPMDLSEVEKRLKFDGIDRMFELLDKFNKR